MDHPHFKMNDRLNDEMGEGGLKQNLHSVVYGWNRLREQYMCCDGTEFKIPRRIAKIKSLSAEMVWYRNLFEYSKWRSG